MGVAIEVPFLLLLLWVLMVADSKQRVLQERDAPKHSGQREDEDVVAAVLGATLRLRCGTHSSAPSQRQRHS